MDGRITLGGGFNNSPIDLLNPVYIGPVDNANPAAQFHVVNSSPSQPVARFDMAAGQTANGIELNSSTGTGGDIFKVNYRGDTFARSLNNLYISGDNNSINLAGVPANLANSVNIGTSAQSNPGGITIGYGGYSGSAATGVGQAVNALADFSVAVGRQASTVASGDIAIGYLAASNVFGGKVNVGGLFGTDAAGNLAATNSVSAKGYSAACRTVSANDTATLADTNLFVNGAYAETLPETGVPVGRRFTLKNISVSSASLTNMVDGTSGYGLPAGAAVTVVWAGSAYYVISSYTKQVTISAGED